MTIKQITKILTEDFTLFKEGGSHDCYQHNKTDVIAIVPKHKQETPEIIFVCCKQDEIKMANNFGVKFRYSTPAELINLIIAICENQ